MPTDHLGKDQRKVKDDSKDEKPLKGNFKIKIIIVKLN
jgi:hypothetical protein